MQYGQLSEWSSIYQNFDEVMLDARLSVVQGFVKLLMSFTAPQGYVNLSNFRVVIVNFRYSFVTTSNFDTVVLLKVLVQFVSGSIWPAIDLPEIVFIFISVIFVHCM